MIVVYLILGYIVSIFSCRYVFRLHYKWGVFLKQDCEFSLLWIIPVVNIVISAVFFILACGGDIIGDSVKINNKFWKWFSNQNL